MYSPVLHAGRLVEPLLTFYCAKSICLNWWRHTWHFHYWSTLWLQTVAFTANKSFFEVIRAGGWTEPLCPQETPTTTRRRWGRRTCRRWAAPSWASTPSWRWSSKSPTSSRYTSLTSVNNQAWRSLYNAKFICILEPLCWWEGPAVLLHRSRKFNWDGTKNDSYLCLLLVSPCLDGCFIFMPATPTCVRVTGSLSNRVERDEVGNSRPLWASASESRFTMS